MSENRDYEELKERVNALESQVQTLINQEKNSAVRFFIDFFRGFFVVLGALFWIVVIDVVLINIASRWDLPVADQGGVSTADIADQRCDRDGNGMCIVIC